MQKAVLSGTLNLAFTAPDEGEFCLTEILGNKIITLLSCPISLAIGFLFYSTLLILIYTKIRLHLATVCPSGPYIELHSTLPELSKLQLEGWTNLENSVILCSLRMVEILDFRF